MLYKFKSKATGDLIMLEPQGRQLLSIIGKEPTAQGILLVADMPAAMAALQAAVLAQETALAQAADQAHARGEDPQRPEDVRLRQRAAPFIDMMRRCMKEEHDLVWGV
jgi:hypothetical protein